MMKKPLILLILTVIFLIGFSGLCAQNQYNDFKTMSQKIDALGKEYPTLCKVKSLIKTSGGKDIWAITIGIGDVDNKPAIAVVGGIEGSYLLGKELSLGFAASLLKESSSQKIKDLLNKVTFYILPDVSPDASEQYFAQIKYERNVNSRVTDDDKDFSINEDPYEDLNNDGYITLIRVKDDAGKYIENSDDTRIKIMTEADLSKGETGSYLVFSEGIDNDQDGNFNEDGEGGVNFNRNFTFNYEEYGQAAGLNAVSEPETKAVADFLFDKFNIYTVISFGPQDNLGQPFKATERQPADPSEEGSGRGRGMQMGNRMITSIMRSDEPINKLVSDKYHELTGLKGSPVVKQAPGNFMEWAYYHYGRYSFSTPGWWYPAENGNSSEHSFMKFANQNKMDNVFVPWTEIKHPDFPGKTVEVGGIKPFAMINPPADSLGSLIGKNYNFITAMAAMHPELEFLDIKTENVGENIFRLSLKLHNRGVFATSAEVGVRNTWTRLMRMSIEPSKDQSFLSGEKVQRVNRLQGDDAQEFSWLISGKGQVKITAGAINTGIVTKTIELK